MQFPYQGRIVNLLDTPGHEDFSEDTYRTLTAVDSALMVIDCAKGVEERTIKLMEVCRLRDTPIMTFINKLDRDGREPVELLDEIEKRARHPRARRSPGRSAWAASSARHLPPGRGPHLRLRQRPRQGPRRHAIDAIEGLASEAAEEFLGDRAAAFRDEIELDARRHRPRSTRDAYLAGRQTPVFFGSAINNFGVDELLRPLRATMRPRPRRAATTTRAVSEPMEPALTGFVFKIQANMDPGHRDRIAFLRICSGALPTRHAAASTCGSARRCASTMR